MIRVYCDTGAYRPDLSQLEQAGQISVHQFKYENKNRRIRRSAIPSNLRYKDVENYTYGEIELAFETYGDLERNSDKFNKVLAIIGQHNEIDARHLDSAFMTSCSAFLTSDKDDIGAHREALEALLCLKIFHVPTEWDDFLIFIHQNDQ